MLALPWPRLMRVGAGDHHENEDENDDEEEKDDDHEDENQAGTSGGESSKPDLFLNFILKVRMLRFSRHSRLKCRISSFWEHF